MKSIQVVLALGVRGGWILVKLRFQARVLCRGCSRIAKDIQKNPVFKAKQKSNFD